MTKQNILSQDIEINGQQFHIVGRNEAELVSEARRMEEEYGVTLPVVEYEQFHIGQQVEVIAGYYAGNKGTVIHLQPQPNGATIVQVQWRNNHTKYIPSFALADNTTLQQAWDELQAIPAYVERHHGNDWKAVL